MPHISIDEAELRELQRRAEQMVRGELTQIGQPLSTNAALEDLRRAIDVLGAHTKQGLQYQHAYVAALSTAQEAERGRLARELHDDVVQQLITLTQGIDRVQRLLDRGDAAAAGERLHTMRANLTALVASLRNVISDLRPPALAELGLLPALELLLGRANTDLAVVMQIHGTPQRLAPQSELALFRIIQEALSNIHRHAHATRATLTITYSDAVVIVMISDNGSGFDLPDLQAIPDGHWGIRGMRERAELTGGQLEVRSTPGQGTTITVQIPYPGADDRDPVCGMAVSPDDPGAEHNGRLYRFCSPACRDLFIAQPQQYLV
ncbi:MAG TPA: histidine kinase [Roseiflexaceae bacterium]|nr:histidine kinase [Roseiflexaceae bacterium]HMP42850.1 histidine kinase [Roseiflexaceae bacterium]